MPLAFTGIFRNIRAYFGIFNEQFFTDTNLVKLSIIYRNKLLKITSIIFDALLTI